MYIVHKDNTCNHNYNNNSIYVVRNLQQHLQLASESMVWKNIAANYFPKFCLFIFTYNFFHWDSIETSGSNFLPKCVTRRLWTFLQSFHYVLVSLVCKQCKYIANFTKNAPACLSHGHFFSSTTYRWARVGAVDRCVTNVAHRFLPAARQAPCHWRCLVVVFRMQTGPGRCQQRQLTHKRRRRQMTSRTLLNSWAGKRVGRHDGTVQTVCVGWFCLGWWSARAFLVKCLLNRIE